MGTVCMFVCIVMFTPPANCREYLPGHFKVKEYCPLVFRDLRHRFGVEDLDYKVRPCEQGTYIRITYINGLGWVIDVKPIIMLRWP